MLAASLGTIWALCLWAHLHGQTTTWTTGPGPIYYNAGSVGIGTATPSLKAEIANGGSLYNLYLSGFAPSLCLGGSSD